MTRVSGMVPSGAYPAYESKWQKQWKEMVNQRNRDQSARRLVKTILESRTAVAGNTEAFEVLFCDEVPARDRERRLKLIRVHLTRLASRQRGLIFELQDIEAQEVELGIANEIAMELEQLLFGVTDDNKASTPGSETQKRDSSLRTDSRHSLAFKTPSLGNTQNISLATFYQQAEKRLSLCDTLPTSPAIARLFLNNMKRKAEIFRILLELDVKFASSVMTQLEVKRIKGNPFLEFFTRDTVEAKLWWPLIRIVLKETAELVNKTGPSKSRSVYQGGVTSMGKKHELKSEPSGSTDKLAKKRKDLQMHKKREKAATQKQPSMSPLARGNDFRSVLPRSRVNDSTQNETLKPIAAQPWASRLDNSRRLLPQPFSLDSLSTGSGSSSGPAGVVEEAPSDATFKRGTSQEDMEGPYSENSTTETLTRPSKRTQQARTSTPTKRTMKHQYTGAGQGSYTAGYYSEGRVMQECELNHRTLSCITAVSPPQHCKMPSMYCKKESQKETYVVAQRDNGIPSEDTTTETNSRDHGLHEAGPGEKALYQVIAPYECCAQDGSFSYNPYSLARGSVQRVETHNTMSEYDASLNEPYHLKNYPEQDISGRFRGASGVYEQERGKELCPDDTLYSQTAASIPRLNLSQDKDWAWSVGSDNSASGTVHREGTHSTIYVSNEKALGGQIGVESQQLCYPSADTPALKQDNSFTEPPYGYHRQGAMEFSRSLLRESEALNSAEDIPYNMISVGRVGTKSSAENLAVGARVPHQTVSSTVQAANSSSSHAAFNAVGLPVASHAYSSVAPDAEGDPWRTRAAAAYASPMAPFGWTSNLGASLQAAKCYTESPLLLKDALPPGRTTADNQDRAYLVNGPAICTKIASGSLPAGHPRCHASQGRHPAVGDPSHAVLYSAASPLYGQQNYLSGLNYLAASWTPQAVYPTAGAGGSLCLKGPVDHKKAVFHKNQRRARTITDQGIEARRKDEIRLSSSEEQRGEDQPKAKNMFLSWIDKVADGFQSTKQRPKFYCT